MFCLDFDAACHAVGVDREREVADDMKQRGDQ